MNIRFYSYNSKNDEEANRQEQLIKSILATAAAIEDILSATYFGRAASAYVQNKDDIKKMRSDVETIKAYKIPYKQDSLPADVKEELIRLFNQYAEERAQLNFIEGLQG